MSLVCVLHYNRECSWKPVLPSIVCVLHSHMDSHGLNQSTFVGILPLWYRNFWRSTIFQGVRCETSHFGICCSQIQICSFYLLKSWGAHWASRKAKDLMPTHTKKFNIWSSGLNSMQGREARHVKLAWYVENKRNAKKSLRWWTVFRHKFVHVMCLRERNPNSITYCIEERNSAILTFLGEFKIVTTGFALVDFHVGYFFHYGALSRQSVTQFPPT